MCYVPDTVLGFKDVAANRKNTHTINPCPWGAYILVIGHRQKLVQ